MERNYEKIIDENWAGVNDSFHYQNVQEKTFIKAAQIFIQLNFCPSKMILLYRDVFNNTHPKKVLEALTIIRKTALNREKIAAEKIFEKALNYLQPLYFDRLSHFYENTRDYEICKSDNFTNTGICKDQRMTGCNNPNFTKLQILYCIIKV